MGKQSIARPRPARKPTGGPVAHPPKGLTLADVTVTRRVLDHELTRISGPELAQLIDAMKPRDGRPPLVDCGSIWEELDCLAELVQALGGADHANREPGSSSEIPLDKSLYWVGESLRRIGHRVMALEQHGNAAPNWYAVEVKK